MNEHIQDNTGFVAGTLVHTDKGLVPIQDIKVGDMVLSKPEDGSGQVEYKPVLSTFKSPKKEKIVKVAYTSQFARERDENDLSYILCTPNHPFWINDEMDADINSKLTGEWQSAEDLSGRYLVSAQGDTLIIDDYACLPVRTLPNFPKGCAYTQQIFDHDFWQYDGGYPDVHYIQFTDEGYQYISYAGNTDEGREEFEEKWRGYSITDVAFELNEHEPIKIDPKLFEVLDFRIGQDADKSSRSKEALLKSIDSGKKFFLSKEDELKGFRKIEELGDATGLKRHSIHFSMQHYSDPCPNPYEDYVYNIEVADNHTYFVGHDAVWVHNCDPSTIKDEFSSLNESNQ